MKLRFHRAIKFVRVCELFAKRKVCSDLDDQLDLTLLVGPSDLKNGL